MEASVPTPFDPLRRLPEGRPYSEESAGSQAAKEPAYPTSLDRQRSQFVSFKRVASCANAGSQLVILAGDGTIYWPIADITPSSGQNPKLLPFAAEKVTASGKLYKRGDSKAIGIEKIEAQATQE